MFYSVWKCKSWKPTRPLFGFFLQNHTELRKKRYIGYIYMHTHTYMYTCVRVSSLLRFEKCVITWPSLHWSTFLRKTWSASISLSQHCLWVVMTSHTGNSWAESLMLRSAVTTLNINKWSWKTKCVMFCLYTSRSRPEYITHILTN